jgi:hypothetical protein
MQPAALLETRSVGRMSFRIVRTSVAVLGGLFLLPALPLLGLAAFGVLLIFAPVPLVEQGHVDLGQGFAGLLLLMYCGVPGVVLGAMGVFLVDRARSAFDSTGAA